MSRAQDAQERPVPLPVKQIRLHSLIPIPSLGGRRDGDEACLRTLCIHLGEGTNQLFLTVRYAIGWSRSSRLRARRTTAENIRPVKRPVCVLYRLQ
jgi:hypothetical protein